jgi:hypothetical protein
MNSPFECIECGFSLRKKPLECEVSVYSNSENALAENPGRAFDLPASASKLKTGVPAKVHQWGQQRWAEFPIGEAAQAGDEFSR